MKEEVFVDYIFDSKYLIGSLGTVKKKAYYDRRKRFKKEKIYKIWTSTTGYPMVSFFGSHKSLHRLIATHFIPNPENKKEVNHKNGLRHDFRISNLEWVTRQENQIHSWRDLGRRATWSGKGGFSFHSSKPVNQYDVDGNFVTRYGSASAAAKNNGWHQYAVQWAIDKKAGYYKGFNWTYASNI